MARTTSACAAVQQENFFDPDTAAIPTLLECTSAAQTLAILKPVLVGLASRNSPLHDLIKLGLQECRRMCGFVNP
eukprot:4173414-Amphidinium_carterae.1